MKSRGKCKFCGKTVSGSAMMRHLQSCKERVASNESEDKKENLFLIRAGAGPFWVYFEAKASSSLEDIDRFLRDLWLECCGHLSSFTINNAIYDSNCPMEGKWNKMDIKLSKVLKEGTKFKHEYDFGTTTELELLCISEREGDLEENISVIARNDLPEFNCDNCGKPAKEICTECVWDGKGLLCESCAKKHECDEEMFLPVVNSPRMGMCGYTGND